MSFMQSAPEPATPLGRLRLLSPSASVRVSPLCLGAMNFGTAWEQMLGKCEKDTAFAMMDYFFESGGNFIDTANNYQAEQSETWIGEWMAQRQNRDQMVIATKYTTNFRSYKGFDKHIPANYGGSGTKSLHLSVEASLKKLQTSYIDILYVHWYDFTTSIPEMMLALNALLNQGKVLYLGASDLPAYVVSKANQYARDHGLRGFVVYQGLWSAANRDFERDILHMVRDEGMGIAPWGALGGGNFKTSAQREEMKKNNEQGRVSWRESPNHAKVTDKLEVIAKEKNTLITSVALAYVMHKAPYVFPIVGGRKVDHLKGNVEALKIALTEKDIEEIETAFDFDVGFPFSTFGKGPEQHFLLKNMSVTDYVQPQLPIRPHFGS